MNRSAVESSRTGVERAPGRRLPVWLPALGFGLILVFVVLSGGRAQAAAATSLAIVPEQSYPQAVVDLAIRGFTNRANDPLFGGSDLATRAQMAVYLSRVLGLPESEFRDFMDVEPADWGFGEIGAVHRAGIMEGTSFLTFSPGAPVTRQEATALLVAALRYAVEKRGVTVADSLTPYKITEWLAGFKDRGLIEPNYAASVAIAYRSGLFDIPAEGWLLPTLSLTHQELVLMLQRAFVQPVSSRTFYPVPVNAVSAYPKLAKGSEGPLVLLVQSRLSALNYPCGNVDGKYSSRTRDAVMAFEKYERMKRTGVVTIEVLERLLAAQAPTPVLHKSGRRVEIDLTRQVLMMIVDDKVIMTIHVSTGRVGTPTGSYHIRGRSRGWVVGFMGPIYSPLPFNGKIAIHGYGSVPSYPASHGCVRTPLWVEDSLVDQVKVGTPVDVFYNKAS